MTVSRTTLTIGSRRELVILACLLAISASFRFWDIDRTSLWLDEAASISQANRSFWQMLVWTARDNYPPLHNIILWITIKFAGIGEAAVRFPSAVIGILLVFSTYKLGRLIWGPAEGLVAGLLAAVLPELIWHGQEARMYSLLALTSTTFVWATIAHFHSPTRASASIAGFAGFCLLMTHIYGAFTFATVNMFVVFWLAGRGELSASSAKSWLRSQAVAIVLFLPWIVALVFRAKHVVSGGFWIPYPDWSYVIDQLEGIFSRPVLVALPLLGTLALVKMGHSQHAREASVQPSTLLSGKAMPLVLCWLIIPFLIGYALSIALTPILVGRYLLGSVPAGILILARSISIVAPGRVHGVVLTGVIVLTILPQSISRVTTDWLERHDMRGAVAYIETHRDEDDAYQLVPWYFSGLFSYYKIGDPSYNGFTRIEDELEPIIEKKRVWLIIAADANNNSSIIIERFINSNFYILDSKKFNRLKVILMNAK